MLSVLPAPISVHSSCSLPWPERPAISGPVYTPEVWYSYRARGAAPRAESPADLARKECSYTSGHGRSSRRSWLVQMPHPVPPLMGLSRDQGRPCCCLHHNSPHPLPLSLAWNLSVR